MTKTLDHSIVQVPRENQPTDRERPQLAQKIELGQVSAQINEEADDRD